MRILFLSKSVLDRRLGAAKLLIELTSALEARGATCTLVDPEALGTDTAGFAAASAAYLRGAASRYDVVEFEYNHLRPADLALLLASPGTGPSRPAYVARCQLWRGHLLDVPPPPLRRLRSRLRRAIHGRRDRERLAAAVAQDYAVVGAADFALVSNEADRQAFLARGFDPDRVAKVSPGIGATSLAALGAVAERPPDSAPVVAFIGTFDERKGGGDFPAIVERLPDVRFRLLGTAGMLSTAEEVLRCFPRRLRHRLEVIPRFDPEELPGLLSGCAAGVFPSYAEGFGYGVLEMLAAGLPVVAYDRPGPPEMLPPEHLVPAGRPDLLAENLATLLGGSERLGRVRKASRERAAQFGWDRAAEQTLAAYEVALERRSALLIAPS